MCKALDLIPDTGRKQKANKKNKAEAIFRQVVAQLFS
jgi:hypothetical protein